MSLTSLLLAVVLSLAAATLVYWWLALRLHPLISVLLFVANPLLAILAVALAFKVHNPAPGCSSDCAHDRHYLLVAVLACLGAEAGLVGGWLQRAVRRWRRGWL